MIIEFYNLAKKENSTKQPNRTDAVQFSCTIKTPSSIQALTVELDLAYVPDWNYAYIPDFERYYFITGTAYNRGLWEISLSVDVLASFKTDVGGTSMYVERSSAAKTGTLIDKAYPVTDAYSVSNPTVKGARTFGNGAIILNVINGDSNTGTTSYVMSVQSFGDFLDNIMVDSDEHISTWDPVLQSIRVINREPLKYVLGCYWVPDSYNTYATGNILSSLTLGNFVATGFSCYNMTNSLSDLTTTYTVTLPKHPQASTRGSFCNMDPFSEYNLDLGPFGSIKLDSAALAEATSITISIMQDVLTGTARAIVETDKSAIIANLAGQWAVPIRLNATATDYVGSIGQYLGGGLAAIGGIIAAPASGGLSLLGVASGVGSMISGLEGMNKGTISSSGSVGALVDHLRTWDLEARFYTIADDNNADNGRPLCKVRTPSTLTGYMKCLKGLVTSSRASRNELDSINAYMEGGFYYE